MVQEKAVDDRNIIGFRDVAARMPSLIRGMPGRIKGLGMVSLQRPETPCGLISCLQTAVKKYPSHPALFYEDQEYSYQELMGWINQAAAYLYATGTRKGDVVAVMLENRPELLVVVAALARLGAVSALLNTSQRGAVLRHSVTLVAPTKIIVGTELMEAVTPLAEALPSGESNCLCVPDSGESAGTAVPEGWINLIQETSRYPKCEPEGAVVSKAEEPFCYFYTSGTTGLPKAAILTHGRFMKAYAGVGLASIQLKPKDRALICLPFYHATALVVGWSSVLAGGAALVMVRHFSASRFWEQIRNYEVTAFCYVGELCRYLLANPPSEQDRQHQVRLMFGNGLRPSIWQAFKQRFGIDSVIEFYGSSEGNVGFLNLFNFDCTVGFTTVPYAIVAYDLERDEPVRFSDGFMRKVSKGESGLLLGEINERSPFDGYTDPEKTERTIVRNVFRAGDAWFNTGDLMRDQGFRHAQFVDRLGDTFRWKGENVSTTEVENVLSEMDEIIDGVVYGVEIPEASGRAGMASIRLQADCDFDADATYQHLRAALPKYAVPVFIRIVQQMVTTGTHKYQKGELKKVGFDLTVTADPVWVLLPGSQRYQRMDARLHASIVAGEQAF